MSDDDDEARRKQYEATAARLVEQQRPGVRDWLAQPQPAHVKRLLARLHAGQDPELQPDAARVELTFWERLAKQQPDKQQPDNPLFAWHARRLAREAGLPLPEWVERYFDQAAAAIFAEIAAPDTRGRVKEWLPDALGFVDQVGARGPVNEYARALRDLEIWEIAGRVDASIFLGRCPYCAPPHTPPGGGTACDACQGTGLWNALRGSSVDAITAELWAARGKPLAEETIRKIRTRVKALITTPL